MCSNFIARTVRTAVPRGCRSRSCTRVRTSDLPAGPAHGRPARTRGDGGRPTVCRQPARDPQGTGRVHPGDGACPPAGSGGDLVIVGGGPYETTLQEHRRRCARRLRRLRRPGLRGGPAPVLRDGRRLRDAVPTRLGGMEVEGWGNVFIEASACGRPVVVGDSGGARETVVDGETGLLVDGTRSRRSPMPSPGLLADPARARRMGRRGGNAWSVTTHGRRSRPTWLDGSGGRQLGWFVHPVGGRGVRCRHGRAAPDQAEQHCARAAPSCTKGPAGAGCASTRRIRDVLGARSISGAPARSASGPKDAQPDLEPARSGVATTSGGGLVPEEGRTRSSANQPRFRRGHARCVRRKGIPSTLISARPVARRSRL